MEGVQKAMQSINGMQVLDQSPGVLGGAKTLNVRRTGAYANQAIDLAP
jgi:UDP-N-acetylenolpyruvoylglucosamine reductase